MHDSGLQMVQLACSAPFHDHKAPPNARQAAQQYYLVVIYLFEHKYV